MLNMRISLLFFLSLLIIQISCYAQNETGKNILDCEVKWKSSIVISLRRYFQWSKFVFTSYEEETCLLEFMFEKFSLNFIPSTVIPFRKLILNKHKFSAVIIFISKLSNVNFIIENLQKQFESRYYPQNWVLIHANEVVDFHSFFIPHDVNIFLVEDKLSQHVWSVYRLYTQSGNEVIRKYLGFGDENLNTLNMEMISSPAQKIGGNKIRLTTKSFPPYFSYNNLKPKNGEKLIGVYGEIIATLQSYLNFSIYVETCEDNQFGIRTGGSQVSGILGMLYRNESDIGVALTLSKQRIEIINYSPELHTMKMKILYHQIYGAKPRFFFYLEPYTLPVWITEVSIMVLVAILINIVYVCYAKYIKRVPENQVKWEWLNNISDSQFYTMYTIQRTGVAVPLYFLADRIILQVFHIYALFLHLSYGSALTSLLTITKSYEPFQSLDDVLYKSDYAISTLLGTSAEELFKTSQKGVFALGWEKIQTNPSKYIVTSNVAGIQLVYNEKAVFIMEEISLAFILNGNCSFRFVEHPIYSTELCIGYRKGFPYRNLFNKNLQKLKETGVLAKINARNIPKDHNQVCELTSPFLPLDIDRIKGVFFTPFLGIVWSLATLAIELYVHKKGIFDRFETLSNY